MGTFNEYYKALTTESNEELSIRDLIQEENTRFEMTDVYKEHRKKLNILYDKQNKAFKERMDAVKETRPQRKRIVDGDFKIANTPKKEDSKEFTDAVAAFSKLSDHEKRRLWYKCAGDEIPVDESQKIDDETMNELHNILVQTVIDFINERGLKNVDGISFSADGLLESAEYGQWTCATDSFLTLEGVGEVEYTTDDGDKKKYLSRVEIGKSW